MKNLLKQLMNQRGKGQGIAEYALILVFCSAVVVVSFEYVGPALGNAFVNTNCSLGASIASDGASPSEAQNGDCDRTWSVSDSSYGSSYTTPTATTQPSGSGATPTSTATTDLSGNPTATATSTTAAATEATATSTGVEATATATPTTASQVCQNASEKIDGFRVGVSCGVFDGNNTTFTYTVIGEGAAHDLSHFTVGIPTCTTPLQVVSQSPNNAIQMGLDPTTNVTGIKWDFGLSKTSSLVYTVTFAGNVPTGAVDVAVKAGRDPEVKPLLGASCSSGGTVPTQIASNPTSTVTPTATVTAAPTTPTTTHVCGCENAPTPQLVNEAGVPAYYPVVPCFVKHWNGQGHTEWRITNPNTIPLQSSPDTKVLYNWTVYDGFNGSGRAIQSASAWDNGNPNPVDTPYSMSMVLSYYIVQGGQASAIKGTYIANASTDAANCQNPSPATTPTSTIVAPTATATNTVVPPTQTATPTQAAALANPYVQIKREGTDNNQQSGYRIRIYNPNTTAMGGVSARFYFTAESGVSANQYMLANWWNSQTVTISGPTQVSGDLYYFTFTVANAINGNTVWNNYVEVTGAMHLSTWANQLDTSNDWWHSNITGSLAQTQYVPAYINGNRVWGNEPAAPAAPTATNTPVPPTATNTPVPPTATPTNTPVPASMTLQLVRNGTPETLVEGTRYCRLNNTINFVGVPSESASDVDRVEFVLERRSGSNWVTERNQTESSSLYMAYGGNNYGDSEQTFSSNGRYRLTATTYLRSGGTGSAATTEFRLERNNCQ